MLTSALPAGSPSRSRRTGSPRLGGNPWTTSSPASLDRTARRPRGASSRTRASPATSPPHERSGPPSARSSDARSAARSRPGGEMSSVLHTGPTDLAVDFGDTVDVVVVGPGPAGYSPAITARKHGADDLQREKASRGGGA